MRSMLDASARQVGWGQYEREREKKLNVRTKEPKVAGMDDSFCIRFTRQVIEGRETTADIGDTEYPAMDSV
jgi:hypothetical protein